MTQAGWSAGLGSALGAVAAVLVAPARLGSGFQLLIGSGLGGAAGAGLASGDGRDPMQRMEQSMDGMFLGSVMAAVATALLLPHVLGPVHPARHHLPMVVMDALMGGMIGGGAGAWWPPPWRLPRLVWMRRPFGPR